jgi:two-component system, LytTR family, sensor kinase
MTIAPERRSRPRRWLFIAGLWALFFAFYTSVSYYYRVSTGLRVRFWRLIPGEALYVGLWGLLTPLILELARRYPVERRNWATRIPLHTAFAIAVALLQRAVFDLIFMRLFATGDTPFSWTAFRQSIVGNFDYGMFLYLIVLLIGLAVDFHNRFQKEQIRASQLRADLASAKLGTLQMQLQPHFLFNTLNSIAVLVRSDPDGAGRMIGRLADLLRATLEHSEVRLVPLRKELELLESYLQIELVRFGDRLRVVREVDPRTLEWEVPFLILQPLVENAIRHGIGVSPGVGEVAVRTALEDGTLLLEVRNTGDAGSSAVVGSESGDGRGVGLANTRARLRELYGDGRFVTLAAVPGGGSVVSLRIPAPPSMASGAEAP